MTKQDSAQCLAQPNFVGIKEVRRKGEEDVYCLVTKKNKNFVANGIVVKNCDALRYAIYTHFFNKSGSSLTATDIDRMYNESMGQNQFNLPDQFIDPMEYGGY